MALWLVRAGKYGEHEQRFFATGHIYLTWGGLEKTSLADARDYDAVKAIVDRTWPDAGTQWRGHGAGQIGAFVITMQPGDWVVTPRKQKSAIAIGEITGPYEYHAGADGLYQHSRAVKWLNVDVPRAAFDQDLLYSFGSLLTICEIKRNDAERRVRAMVRADGKPPPEPDPGGKAASPGGEADLAQLARDSIARVIQRHFQGHGMARLVAAILDAEGYTTHVSPPGPDKGVDILAAPGPLGFGRPRICVQVKSGDTPVDRPTLDQLIGVMQNVGADQGLLVSWSGFKSSVDRETASQFFRVRLWDADALIEALLAQYDKLPEDLRAELPLKRIWAPATLDEDA